MVELLAAHSSLAVAVSDTAGRITFSTPGLEKVLGWSPQGSEAGTAAEGVVVHDATGRVPLQRHEMPLGRALTGEVVIDQVCTLHRSDGEVLHLRCNAAPLREADGRVRGAFSLVQDITAEHRTHLDQDRLRRRLVSTVNHELRTPMTIIMGHAEILLEAVDDLPAPYRRSVEALARASRQLAGLAGTITALGDLEDARHLQREPVDLAKVLTQVAQLHERAAAAAGVHLVVELAGPLEGDFDVRLLHRAVGELLDNAIEAAPAGSRVRLVGEARAGVAEVRVLDVGPGVPREQRDRLLQPFESASHLDPSLSSTGLGLPLARAVITAHGGSLGLEANTPCGLVALVRLPCHLGVDQDR